MLSGCFVLFLALTAWFPAIASPEAAAGEMTVSQAIDIALAADLSLKSSQSNIEAARAAKKAQRAQFFPTFSTSYTYERYDEAQMAGPVVAYAQDQATFATTLTQPVFTGFVLQNRYQLAGLGLNIAEVQERLVRQDVSLRVKQAYFSVLKFRKLLGVAKETVKQIEAQKVVAENFYQVGMTPLNDLLQAQVELSNAEQARIVAVNNLEIARSNFNTILRRPISAPVSLSDILEYAPFQKDLAACLTAAEQGRLETQIADLQVEAARKEIALAEGGYYPSVNFRGSYYQTGDDWTVDGGEGISDPEGWLVAVEAKWNFWEWGKTRYRVTEKQRRLQQAQYDREDIRDRIRLEVKQAYLRTKEGEDNIRTTEKAIEQAKENYRINQERYKEQVATNTDVLIAQTLLTRTMTNYYSALYDFQLSKAALLRAMGQEVEE